MIEYCVTQRSNGKMHERKQKREKYPQRSQ